MNTFFFTKNCRYCGLQPILFFGNSSINIIWTIRNENRFGRNSTWGAPDYPINGIDGVNGTLSSHESSWTCSNRLTMHEGWKLWNLIFITVVFRRQCKTLNNTLVHYSFRMSFDRCCSQAKFLSLICRGRFWTSF